MKNTTLSKLFLFAATMFISACASTSNVDPRLLAQKDNSNTLYVYQDGRMFFKARQVDVDDVVIYADGRGGERAAIKMIVPIHPDYYRDSIVVVRVNENRDVAVSQNDAVKQSQVN